MEYVEVVIVRYKGNSVAAAIGALLTMEQTRAILLSALLVVSTVGATVAFAGGSLAASSATIDVTPAEAGETATHNATAVVGSNDGGSSLNGFQIDYAEGTPATDASNVDVSDINEAYIRQSDGVAVPVRSDLSEVTTSNNGATITFRFGGSYSISEGDTVVLNYTDVQNPDSGGTYDAQVAINPQSSSPEPGVAFTIEDMRNATIDATPDTEDTTATHTLLTRPKEAYNETALTNVTVDYLAFESSGGNLSSFANLTAFVDADGDREYDETERNLTDDIAKASVEGHGTELRIEFDGAGTVNATDEIVLQYDGVVNPNDDEYTVDVFLNGDAEAHAHPTLTVAPETETRNSGIGPFIPAPGETTPYFALGQVSANDDSDSLNSIEVDFHVGTDSTDVSNVGQADIERVGIESADDDVNFSTLDQNVGDDLSGVTSSNNGHTLILGFGGNYQLHDDDIVFVEFEDARNPSSAGEYQASFGVNVQSTDNPARTTYNISALDPLAALNVSDDTDGAVTTHTATYRPGSAINGTNASNITVVYDAGATDVSNVTERDVTAYLGEENTETGVQGVSTDGNEITVNLTANPTLNYTTPLTVEYADVGNPTTAGDYGATVYINGNETHSASDGFSIDSDTVPYDANVDAVNDTANATTTHRGNVSVNANDASDSLNGLEVDYQGTGVDVSNVTQEDVQYVSIDGNADGDYDDPVDARNTTDDLDAVKLSNNAKTLLMEFGGSYNLPNDAVVSFAFADAVNPDASGDYEVGVDLNVQSNENAALATLNVTALSTGNDDSDSNGGGSGGGGFFPPPQNSEPDTTTETTTVQTTTEEAETTTERTTEATETTTEEAVTTTEPEETVEPEETTSESGGTPGFTVGATLVALLAVALLAFRQQ